MKKNHNFFAKFSTALQVFVILFAIVGVAAAEDVPQLPGMPIVLSGDIYVNGEKAPVGTLITVNVNGEYAGSTEVTSKGVYGDETKLLITCEPEDYSDLEFYINNGRVKVDPVINPDEIDSDGFLTLTIDAEVAENAKVSGGMGGGMGGFLEEATEEPDTGNINPEEAAISKAPLKIGEDATSSAHEKSIPVEEGSNTMLIIACGLGLLLVAGLLMYKSKKNQKE